MPKNLESKNIEQLMAEADELIRQINSEVQSKIEEKGTSGISSGADGMHEAIQDIVKAMKNFKNYIF